MDYLVEASVLRVIIIRMILGIVHLIRKPVESLRCISCITRNLVFSARIENVAIIGEKKFEI